MVTVEMLEKLEIFDKLTNQELGKILEICSLEEFQNQDRLFMEGEKASDMWVVAEGKVELRFEMPNTQASSSNTTMSAHGEEIPQSQVFGWSCFIPPYKMRLSAYCTSRKCQVVKVHGEKLNQLMASEPSIGFKIMGYLVQVVGFRFKQMQDEVVKFMGLNLMNSW
ncbi:MAG: cyclic nucleotide-binding domain-containing protein [Desulfobacter sp.]|nr:MAG: cyclic nucleotide-binding domain-containing protein [Desulfobacter sp.]